MHGGRGVPRTLLAEIPGHLGDSTVSRLQRDIECLGIRRP